MTELKLARWFGYAGLVLGGIRLLAYLVFPFSAYSHSQWNLGLAFHAFVSGCLLVWLTKREERKELSK